MKSSELQKQIRIGNYLLGKCIDDLDDRKEWWEIYKIQDAEHLMGIKEDWDKPVELTEEILLKCGFKIGNKYSNEDARIGDFVITFGDNFYYKKTQIKHLHQLQNLYFAITGFELEINL